MAAVRLVAVAITVAVRLVESNPISNAIFVHVSEIGIGLVGLVGHLLTLEARLVLGFGHDGSTCSSV